MKKLLPLFLSLFCAVYAKANDQINPILGNSSYIAKTGAAPSCFSNEKFRIQTHLLYVEDILRAANTDHLSNEEKTTRMRIIGLLHEYASAAQFPHNYDCAERRPCFIDRDQNICAVGYLVEQTAGRMVAEKINSKYQYAYINEMNLPELDSWIAVSGLSKTECAMIQPTYSPTFIYPAYAGGNIVDFQNFLASQISLDSRIIDSADVKFTIDELGRTKNIQVTAKNNLKEQISKAIGSTVFKAAYYSGWNADPSGKVAFDASFKLIFNLPSDSIYHPIVTDMNPEKKSMAKDTLKDYVQILVSCKDNSNCFSQGVTSLVNNTVTNPQYAPNGMVSVNISKTFMRPDSTISITIMSPVFRTIVLNHVPFQNQTIRISPQMVQYNTYFYEYLYNQYNGGKYLEQGRIPIKTNQKA
jgi:hypothetical protein